MIWPDTHFAASRSAPLSEGALSSGVEPGAEAALARLRGLCQAIARVPAFAGLCYTQLTDVEQEVNGLLTFDRKPKFDTGPVREINGLVR